MPLAVRSQHLMQSGLFIPQPLAATIEPNCAPTHTCARTRHSAAAAVAGGGPGVFDRGAAAAAAGSARQQGKQTPQHQSQPQQLRTLELLSLCPATCCRPGVRPQQIVCSLMICRRAATAAAGGRGNC